MYNYFYRDQRHVPLKFFQVVLTLFYGQYISNSIFDNFILTIPELSDKPSWYYVIKVIIGVIIFCTSIFSLIVVWRKHFRLIFLSGIILLFVFVTTIVMTTVLLTLDYETKTKSEMGKLIAEVTVESIFQMIGIIATFFMASRRQIKKRSHNNLPRKSMKPREQSIDETMFHGSRRPTASSKLGFRDRYADDRSVSEQREFEEDFDEQSEFVEQRNVRQAPYPDNEMELDF